MALSDSEMVKNTCSFEYSKVLSLAGIRFFSNTGRKYICLDKIRKWMEAW